MGINKILGVKFSYRTVFSLIALVSVLLLGVWKVLDCYFPTKTPATVEDVQRENTNSTNIVLGKLDSVFLFYQTQDKEKIELVVAKNRYDSLIKKLNNEKNNIDPNNVDSNIVHFWANKYDK